MNIRGVLTALSAFACLAGCASAPDGAGLAGFDRDNELLSKDGSAYCQASAATLQGRGSAGGLGPMQGLTAGGYVYNTMLMGLSPVIALKDQAALERKVQTVLEDESDGRELEWTAPSSGQKVIMKPGSTNSSFRLISVPRAEEVGRTPDSFSVERGGFITSSAAPLRPSPTTSGNVVIDTIPAGYKLEVMGRVRGVHSENWYMVGANGRAFGYMEPVHLRPAGLEKAPLYHRLTGPTLRDPMSATVTCRELTYKTDLGMETLNACRTPEGRWIADPPEGSATGASCLPVSRSFLLR